LVRVGGGRFVASARGAVKPGILLETGTEDVVTGAEGATGGVLTATAGGVAGVVSPFPNVAVVRL